MAHIQFSEILRYKQHSIPTRRRDPKLNSKKKKYSSSRGFCRSSGLLCENEIKRNDKQVPGLSLVNLAVMSFPKEQKRFRKGTKNALLYSNQHILKEMRCLIIMAFSPIRVYFMPRDDWITFIYNEIYIFCVDLY